MALYRGIGCAETVDSWAARRLPRILIARRVGGTRNRATVRREGNADQEAIGRRVNLRHRRQALP